MASTPPFVLVLLPFLSECTRTKSSTGTFPHSRYARETLLTPAVSGSLHTPRETQHCPDDEPLRIIPHQSRPGSSHTIDCVTSDDGVITSTSANMLALVSLQCMGHLFVASCIHTSPASLPSSLSPPTECLVIASLSLCGAYVAGPAHFRPHVLRSQPSQNTESLCMENHAQVGHFLLCCVPLTSVTPSWVPKT